VSGIRPFIGMSSRSARCSKRAAPRSSRLSRSNSSEAVWAISGRGANLGGEVLERRVELSHQRPPQNLAMLGLRRAAVTKRTSLQPKHEVVIDIANVEVSGHAGASVSLRAMMAMTRAAIKEFRRRLARGVGCGSRSTHRQLEDGKCRTLARTRMRNP
jgi:hypothetical protein